ncbi:alpha/beta fold hydrolase [Paucibacter sp. PLA-PC-4]|uniref:alpha/beta hydrolase family protein n=1 Tax=Paucibacter sp. PLA-PC-4 TaxID=2993655 RepID=UPI00224AA5C2|nr:alpha/beta fold hydrolase [Paucibacter sp. PLA-PC-4]MCX2865084.1 alpha/beta fold hydrolase [Paucibacter sp. PLA-PC-4]
MPLLTRALLLAIVSLALTAARAQPLSRDEVFGQPTYADAQLSPSGRYLAVLVPDEQRRRNLAILDLDSRRFSARIGVPGADVGTLMWLGDERMVFSLTQLGQSAKTRSHVGGLYVVGRDGKEQRRLFQSVGEWANSGARRMVQMWPLQRVPGSDEELIVAGNDIDEHSIDLYRLNVLSGKRRLLTEGRPPRINHWLLDRQLQPRAAVGGDTDSPDQISHYRDADGRWRELWRTRGPRDDVNVPLSVEADGTLLVASNVGRDTTAVREYDPQRRQWGETLVEHPRHDVGVDALGGPIGVTLHDEASHELLGFEVSAERPLRLWMDERRRALQALVDGALPGRSNRLQFSAGPRVLVASSSDTEATSWYLMDSSQGRLSLLLNSRPALDPARVPATEVVQPRSRDGQALLAYVLKPPRAAADQALPVVILVHGGPWHRGAVWGDEYGDMATARWLASRGYLVVLPSFRGSLGFGKQFLRSSRGQFGLAMQDDLDDVLAAVLKRADADPKRLCIMGASYGGYASLMAAARAPERYRCVVAGLPLSDLAALLDSGWSDISSNERAREFWVEMVGDPKQQRAALQAVSPAHLADRIKSKVMIYAGVDDRRTPLEQAESLRSALRRAGNEPLWLAKYGEGHGYRLADNHNEMLDQLERFLAEQLRP